MKNVTPKNNKGGCGLLAGIFLLALTLIGAGLAAHWTFNRVYVQPGQSLMLRYKGPIVFGAKNSALPGHLAKPGEIGIQEHLLGPGRHFYCPIWWERTVVPDAVVSPGEVAVVTSKLGEQLPKGEFLVDGDLGTTTQKGILRRVCTPGRYRVHPLRLRGKNHRHPAGRCGR